METHPSYNLTAAVEKWRLELNAQSDLSGDDQRELETHLWDALAELRERGLSDEESFVLARRRLGPTQEIAEEFTKANPGRVWRERVFWGLVFLLVYQVWTSTAGIFAMWLNVKGYMFNYNPSGWAHLFQLASLILLPYGPLVYFVRWISQNESLVSSVFIRRRRFVFAAMGALVTRLVGCAAALNLTFQSHPVANSKAKLLFQFSASFLWIIVLLGLFAWLHPDRLRKAAA
jgi:hypothetical protein